MYKSGVPHLVYDSMGSTYCNVLYFETVIRQPKVTIHSHPLYCFQQNVPNVQALVKHGHCYAQSIFLGYVGEFRVSKTVIYPIPWFRPPPPPRPPS